MTRAQSEFHRRMAQSLPWSGKTRKESKSSSLQRLAVPAGSHRSGVMLRWYRINNWGSAGNFGRSVSKETVRKQPSPA